MTSIRWVQSFADVPESLWTRAFRPPLEGRWWYAAMELAGLQDQFQFSYGIIDRDGISIGIVPTFLMDVPLDIIAPDHLASLVRAAGQIASFLQYQRTLFVGSPGVDEGSIGLIQGVSLHEVLPIIQAELDRRAVQMRASMIVWKDFTDEDATAFAPMVASKKLFPVISFPGTRIPLPVGKIDSYMSALKGSHRHNLKKKLRLGREKMPTTASIAHHPDARTLADIFGLFWQTYLKGRTKFEKLNIRFFELIAAEPTSYFVLLRATSDQRLVGFMLCFDCGKRVVNKFIGIDYSVDRSFLYFQLWHAAVEWAMSRGFSEFQSGQTGYRAKVDVGHSLVPLTNFARCRNPLLHRLFAWQARGINWRTIDEDLVEYLDAAKKKQNQADAPQHH